MLRSIRSISTRRLVYDNYGPPDKVIRLETAQLAEPTASQVLLEFQAAPINPADLNQIQGVYAHKPPLPAVGGIEGVARVVQTGASVKGVKVGDQVFTDYNHVSSWSEKAVFDEKHVIKIDNELEVEHSAFLKVNPTSALCCLREFVGLKKGDWVLQNCANSAFGKQVIQISRILGFKTFNVIRNRENLDPLVAEMKALGANEVITEEQMFDRKNTKLPRVKLALNGVGGKSAMFLSSALDQGGCMVTYGGMSRQSVQAPTAPFIFKNVSLRGFWLYQWVNAQNDEHRKLKGMYQEIADWMKAGDIVKQPYVPRKLEEHVEALQDAETKFDKKQLFLIK